MTIKSIILVLSLLGLFHQLVRAEPVEDKQALLDFIGRIYRIKNLNWDLRTSVCRNWTGITCNHDDSRVISLRLPSFGFRGSIPLNTLSRLSELQILSLRSNNFSGTFPYEIMKLEKLTGLFLEFNNFQGSLPLNFSTWKNLSVLDLANNGFNGSIPSSVLDMTQLVVLNLANNSFSGAIPDLNITTLKVIDLSNNKLTGDVPQSFKRFPSSAFLGNNVTFGDLISPVPPPTIAPKKHSSKSHQSLILGIAFGGFALAFTLLALLFVATKKKREDKSPSDGSLKKDKMVSENQGNGRLTFFEGCNLAFDLEDLLRASAEVLGKGTFGTTYKATLEDSTMVAVKRLKEVIVGKKDFDQQMETFGIVRHENVVPLRAYYYSKDEKLVVYDYYSQGSVAALLHAKRGENRTPLDWETRVKIVVGAARGLNHIHSQNGGKLVHGNIKASNIFINSNEYGCLSDLGLATLMNPITPSAMRSTGYRAPEITDSRKTFQASDIYSFGVLILELLTGKSPVHSSGGEEIIHLVRWVHSVVREEWTGEVFDVELLRYPNIEEEMVSMLQIGMACVTRIAEQRPKIGEVVKMVEEIRSVNTGNTSAGTRSPSQFAEIGPSN